MNILIKKGSPVPVMGHPNEDACYDIIATSEPIIIGESIESLIDGGTKLYKNIEGIQYRTNLFYTPETNNFYIRGRNYEPLKTHYHTHIFVRSSITKTNLMLTTGVSVIDRGYRNELIINFRYLIQPEDLVTLNEGGGTKIYCKINEDKIYHHGSKICQMGIYQTNYANFIEVENLPVTKRDMGGIGSTGN